MTRVSGVLGQKLGYDTTHGLLGLKLSLKRQLELGTVVLSFAWTVPVLNAKQQKREEWSPTAMPRLARTVPSIRHWHIFFRKVRTVWALSGTFVLDIFA